MYIAVDFDGTCVTHDYPRIGEDIGAVPVLKKLVKNGHQLILYTMRSGRTLDDAVSWLKFHEIPLWAINCNPSQHTWTESPKIYANLYIDDAALGIPLINSTEIGSRPYVNWKQVELLLKQKGLIK